MLFFTEKKEMSRLLILARYHNKGMGRVHCYWTHLKVAQKYVRNDTFNSARENTTGPNTTHGNVCRIQISLCFILGNKKDHNDDRKKSNQLYLYQFYFKLKTSL